MVTVEPPFTWPKLIVTVQLSVCPAGTPPLPASAATWVVESAADPEESDLEGAAQKALNPAGGGPRPPPPVPPPVPPPPWPPGQLHGLPATAGPLRQARRRVGRK